MSGRSEAHWEKRFRAARISLPAWALTAPDHCAFSTNASGVWQVWSWDRGSDARIQLTDKATGVIGGAPLPDGSGVVWFDDDAGSEIGRYVVTPFRGGASRALLPTLPSGWSAGLSLRPDRVAAGVATRDGAHRLYVAAGDDEPQVIYAHSQSAQVAGLSRDGTLLAIAHTEHGDSAHPSLRVLDATSGAVVVDVRTEVGITVFAAGWARTAGDQRLAYVTDAEGRTLPGVLDCTTGQRGLLDVTALEGEISVAGWWPDGTALLLVQEHRGRARLHRYTVAEGCLESYDLGGTVASAAVRPDGDVWASFSSAAVPSRIVVVPGGRPDGDPTTLITPPGDPAPPGVPYHDRTADNGEGGVVHAFVALPETGAAPYPLVVDVHGGPTANDTDTFSAFAQAWVDHGYAVALVNYRGSTGYGKAWEDAVIGDPGRPELVDIRAITESLVAEELVDPDRLVVTGGSWGGYVTLMALGTQPELWAAGVAVVPVADYHAAFADESPGLQNFDRTIFGGGPEEVGDLFTERSPITYADQVRAPVLIITGENDTRCPKRQVDNYVRALRDRGHRVVYDVFDAGHGSMAVDETIRQVRLSLEFVADALT